MGNFYHPRNLTSVDFDLTQCSNLEFDMKYAPQSQAPCEGPDLYCEELEYNIQLMEVLLGSTGIIHLNNHGHHLIRSTKCINRKLVTHPVYIYNGLGYWDPDTNNVGGSGPYVNWFTVNIGSSIKLS